MEEIVNRVKESSLITIDLAHFKPSNQIVGIDLADQLWQGLVLKEKDFRAWIKDHQWSQYESKAVFVHCSADAIVPTWAFMLVVSALEEVGAIYLVGSQEDLNKKLIQLNIDGMDLAAYQDGRVIIKGCSDIASPEFAMAEMIHKLQPVVKSIMYGEPCSTVPVFKKK